VLSLLHIRCNIETWRHLWILQLSWFLSIWGTLWWKWWSAL